jgi:hypothetical protein
LHFGGEGTLAKANAGQFLHVENGNAPHDRLFGFVIQSSADFSGLARGWTGLREIRELRSPFPIIALGRAVNWRRFIGR